MSGSKSEVDTQLLSENKLNYLDRNILNYLYKNPKLSDIEFIVNDKRFPANRCVLSAASDVFEAMLLGPFQEYSISDIPISDVVYHESFSSVLSYIYGFGIQVDALSVEMILEVLKLGHRFQLPKLCKALQYYVSSLNLVSKSAYSFGTDAFMELLNVSYIYNIGNLHTQIKAIIKSSTENVNKFLDHPKLDTILCPVLTEMFEADDFYTEEIKIFGAVLKWIHANVTEVTTASNDSKERRRGDFKSSVESVNENGSVKNSDSGIDISSYYSHCLENVPATSSKNSELTEMDEDPGESNDSRETSDIGQLLKTIRSSKISLLDFSIFFEANSDLCKKYNDYVAPIISCSKNKSNFPRKAYVGNTEKRIDLVCNSYVPGLPYNRVSEVSTCGQFKLSFEKNQQVGGLYVKLLLVSGNEPLNFKCTFYLKSLSPFNDSLIQIPSLGEKSHRCSHGYSFTMKNGVCRSQNGYRIQCSTCSPLICISEVDSSMLKRVIENDSFKIVAYIYL